MTINVTPDDGGEDDDDGDKVKPDQPLKNWAKQMLTRHRMKSQTSPAHKVCLKKPQKMLMH